VIKASAVALPAIPDQGKIVEALLEYLPHPRQMVVNSRRRYCRYSGTDNGAKDHGSALVLISW
jgi:hypothetical protein